MSEWAEKPLGELAAIRVSNVDKKSLPSEHPVRLCNYMDVYAGTYLDDEVEYMEATASGREIANFTLQSGDVVITKDSESPDDIGIPALIDQTAGGLVCGYHLAMLRPDKSKVDPLFLLKQIETDAVRRYYLKRAAGSTRYALATGTIETTPIRLAPLDQQRTISRILRALDTQIEATEGLIAKQERVRAGLMQDLFTRGVDEHGQLRPPRDQAPHLYHQTELGWLPLGWEVENFGKRIDVVDPNPSHRYPDEIEEGVPICSTENFSGADAFDVSFAKHVPEPTYIFQNSRCHYHPLDVVFARKGRIGLARRYGEDRKVFSHTVVTMKPLDQTVSRYWTLWLARSDAFLSGIAREMNSNSGVPTLGIEFIKSISVPFPKETEQAVMAGILDQASSAIADLMDSLSKLRLQKSGLMQDLLTGKISVAPLLGSAAA